jgi:glycosyltransferase involved in cell wall biosynthesis
LTLLVSVIIPAYNRALIIGRAIESALSQTHPPAEIIVVDDGSEDQTQEIVRTFPGVRYIRQANTGAAQARNNGVELAGCDYVAFLDSDDLWVHQKLEMQMELIEHLKVPILGSRKRYVHERSRLSLDVDPRGQGLHYINFQRQLKRTWLSPSTVICHKGYFQSFGGFDNRLRIAEDWDLWLRIAFQEPIPRMDMVSTYAFLTKDSLTENRLTKYLFDLEVIKKWHPAKEPRVSNDFYSQWCNSFTINRIQKLLRRPGKDGARLFWEKAREELPLSKWALVTGDILTQRFLRGQL